MHVAGRRFVDRAPGQRTVKVYSNQPEVVLFVNGEPVGAKKGAHVFVFEDVPMVMGENTVCARAGVLADEITLNAVAKPNESYVLPDDEPDAGAVANWFDGEKPVALEYPEGYFSIKDKLKELTAHPEAAAVLGEAFEKMGGGGQAKSLKNMMGMLGGMSLAQILKMAGKRIPAGADAYLNAKLTKIKKP